MPRQFAQEDGRLARIRRTIDWMRDRYDRDLRTQTLAAVGGMSVASFHRHFKATTAISPLRYQKMLRLEPFRRLLAAEARSSDAGFGVGYRSAAQFSREYRRAFGVPPSRDSSRSPG